MVGKEDYPFLLGFGNFSGAMLNFGRVNVHSMGVKVEQKYCIVVHSPPHPPADTWCLNPFWGCLVAPQLPSIWHASQGPGQIPLSGCAWSSSHQTLQRNKGTSFIISIMGLEEKTPDFKALQGKHLFIIFNPVPSRFGVHASGLGANWAPKDIVRDSHDKPAFHPISLGCGRNPRYKQPIPGDSSRDLLIPQLEVTKNLSKRSLTRNFPLQKRSPNRRIARHSAYVFWKVHESSPYPSIFKKLLEMTSLFLVEKSSLKVNPNQNKAFKNNQKQPTKKLFKDLLKSKWQHIDWDIDLSLGVLLRTWSKFRIDGMAPRTKALISMISIWPYSWWRKSCTSWWLVYAIILRFNTSQVVQDFFHQQYEGTILVNIIPQ